MATYPKPQFNRIIETDPQILKVKLDFTEWGTRESLFSQALGSNPKDPYPSKPGAPELTIQHTASGGPVGKFNGSGD